MTVKDTNEEIPLRQHQMAALDERVQKLPADRRQLVLAAYSSETISRIVSAFEKCKKRCVKSWIASDRRGNLSVRRRSGWGGPNRPPRTGLELRTAKLGGDAVSALNPNYF